jgi:magnesium chelatase family protein
LDLWVDVPALSPDVLTAEADGESSGDVRARVVAARERQRARYDGSGIGTNAQLTPSRAARHCALDRAGLRLIQASVARLGLSARGYDRVRAVARTIADLDAADDISADHLAEALQFRPT